jgi:hypothetical protein
MLTTGEMKQEIRDFCINLILDSNVTDWINSALIVDNIEICLGFNYDEKFEASIYVDSSFNEKVYVIDISFYGPKLPIFKKVSEELKKEIELRKSLKKKYDEIKQYLNDKSEFDKMSKVYKLLPVKYLRKKKLDNLNE